MFGISKPQILTGLIYAAWNPSVGLSTKIGWVGSGLGVLVDVSVIAGQRGEIVSWVFRWSQ
jgi:hypothetical protein